METETNKYDKPPPAFQNKLNSVLNDIATKSKKIKLKHVEPKIKSQMPEQLEALLCTKYGDFPMRYDYVTTRFDVKDPEAYKHLEEWGYVVIKDVVPSSKEIETVKDDIWDWMEALSFPTDNKIDRNNPETWHDGNWPTDPDTGIVFSFGVGQTEFMWKCRSYPKIKKAFATIWNTDDLITSFDGINLYRPWKYHLPWVTKGKWWHYDQNARREESRGKQSFQGIVALTDGNEKTGGLAVVPKSHLDHTRICERIHWPSHSDYIPIPKKDRFFDDYRNIGGYLVHYKAGDLIIWDSRLAHCNCPAKDALNIKNIDDEKEHFTEKEKKEKKWKLMRMITYICFVPRYKAKNEILKKRHEISFNMHVTSTHFPQYFRYRLGAGVIGHAKWKLNEYQNQLVGYPRNWLQEFIWQLQYEYKIGFGELWTFSAFIGAIGFAAKVLWFKK